MIFKVRKSVRKQEEKHMIIVLKPRTTEENLNRVIKMVEAKGLEAHVVRGEEMTIIGCIGDTTSRAR